MVGAALGGLVCVRPRVDKQCLSLAHEPSSEVLAFNLGRAPCQGVALEDKGSKIVLGRIEPRRQLPLRQVVWFLHVHVERLGSVARPLHQLPVYHVELPGRLTILQNGRPGLVCRFRLQVFVEVGGGYCSDPVLAVLQCCWRRSMSCCRRVSSGTITPRV